MKKNTAYKFVSLIEVAAVFGVLISLRPVLRQIGFRRWQMTHFGHPIFSMAFLLIFSCIVLITLRKPLNRYGLMTDNLRHQLRIGTIAALLMFPATLGFPISEWLGTSYRHLLGGIILSLMFLISFVLIVMAIRKYPSLNQNGTTKNRIGLVITFLAMVLISGYVLLPISKTLTVAIYTVYAALGEELLFRGYLQSRLNHCFGRPYKLAGVSFGPGLILASVIFGLFHPLQVTAGFPWGWLIMASTCGLVLGYLREKTGGIIAPSIAHGLFILPTAFS